MLVITLQQKADYKGLIREKPIGIFTYWDILTQQMQVLYSKVSFSTDLPPATTRASLINAQHGAADGGALEGDNGRSGPSAGRAGRPGRAGGGEGLERKDTVGPILGWGHRQGASTKPNRNGKTKQKKNQPTKPKRPVSTGQRGAPQTPGGERAEPTPRPSPTPLHTQRTLKDTSTRASAASSSYGPWRQNTRPTQKKIIIIKKRSADLLPRRAAAPAVAAAQTQAGTKWPPRTSWHGRPRAPSAHRAAAGRGAAHVTGSGLAPSQHACGREPPFCVSLRAGPRVMLGVCGAAWVDRCGFCNIHCVFQ